MKKFAKILVVALTVCLIVGVMAVSASAADSDTAAGTIETVTPKLGQVGGAGNAAQKCITNTNPFKNSTHDGASHGGFVIIAHLLVITAGSSTKQESG